VWKQLGQKGVDNLIKISKKDGVQAIAVYGSIGAALDQFTGNYVSGMTKSGLQKVIGTSTKCVSDLGTTIKNMPVGPIDGGY
jgi:hypothetical protein